MKRKKKLDVLNRTFSKILFIDILHVRHIYLSVSIYLSIYLIIYIYIYVYIYTYIYIYILLLLLLITGFGGQANFFSISTQNINLISKNFFHSRVLKTCTYTIQKTVIKAVQVNFSLWNLCLLMKNHLYMWWYKCIGKQKICTIIICWHRWTKFCCKYIFLCRHSWVSLDSYSVLNVL